MPDGRGQHYRNNGKLFILIQETFTKDNLKTGLSMAKGHKHLQMAINTKEIISMVFAKVVALLDGQMVVSMMAILNKVIAIDMVFGSQIHPRIKSIKAIICWIKSTDMASMIGAMGMCIRAITWKIKEMAMDSCIMRTK